MAFTFLGSLICLCFCLDLCDSGFDVCAGFGCLVFGFGFWFSCTAWVLVFLWCSLVVCVVLDFGTFGYFVSPGNFQVVGIWIMLKFSVLVVYLISELSTVWLVLCDFVVSDFGLRCFVFVWLCWYCDFCGVWFWYLVWFCGCFDLLLVVLGLLCLMVACVWVGFGCPGRCTFLVGLL